MLYRFGQLLSKIFFFLFFRVKVDGKNNIPRKGAFLLYANHPHLLDMFLIASICPRQIHYMAKSELFKNKLLGFLIRKVGSFPVNRGKGDIGSVKTVFRLLKDEKVVGVFPEGSRTAKKDLSRKKAGAAMLALATGATILPVGIEGNFKKFFSKLTIVFGKPFVLKGEADMKESHGHSKQELVEKTEYILNTIYALIGQ